MLNLAYVVHHCNILKGVMTEQKGPADLSSLYTWYAVWYFSRAGSTVQDLLKSRHLKHMFCVLPPLRRCQVKQSRGLGLSLGPRLTRLMRVCEYTMTSMSEFSVPAGGTCRPCQWRTALAGPTSQCLCTAWSPRAPWRSVCTSWWTRRRALSSSSSLLSGVADCPPAGLVLLHHLLHRTACSVFSALALHAAPAVLCATCRLLEHACCSVIHPLLADLPLTGSRVEPFEAVSGEKVCLVWSTGLWFVSVLMRTCSSSSIVVLVLLLLDGTWVCIPAKKHPKPCQELMPSSPTFSGN